MFAEAFRNYKKYLGNTKKSINQIVLLKKANSPTAGGKFSQPKTLKSLLNVFFFLVKFIVKISFFCSYVQTSMKT